MSTGDLFAALEATWPPASSQQEDHFMFRDGTGGGKRVTATKVVSTPDAAALAFAEDHHARHGKPDLFTLRSDEAETDAILAQSGYDILDPTVLMECAVDTLSKQPLPSVTAFPIWPALQIMKDIWAEGGIGPDRIAVMDRVRAPKTAILGRIDGRAGGTVFAAVHEDIAMVHALEIVPEQRRKRLACHLMHAAARWGEAHGATRIAIAVTRANIPARKLYSYLGMREVAAYHYRLKR